MKNIVRIGGGSSAYSVLGGLREYTPNLTAIVTMADSGGSTGRLREEQGVLPPGDARGALLALAQGDKLTQDLFAYRFEGKGSLTGHTAGNLIIAALEKITGSFEEAVDEAGRMLNIVGHVVPVTTTSTTLEATLEDGQVISGETAIDIPKHDGDLKITQLKLNPSAKPTLAALHAIEGADLIVIGPGDLFTSILPVLLVDQVAEAIKLSKAKKVYVCNLMTKHGETDKFTVIDFAETLERYLGAKVLNYVVFNNQPPSAELAERYAKAQSFPVQWDDRTLADHHWQPIPAELANEQDFWRHDAAKLAKILLTVSELENVLPFVDVKR